MNVCPYCGSKNIKYEYSSSCFKNENSKMSFVKTVNHCLCLECDQRFDVDVVEEEEKKAINESKALHIIIDKIVDMNTLNYASNVEQYNYMHVFGDDLEESEFELLKGVINVNY